MPTHGAQAFRSPRRTRTAWACAASVAVGLACAACSGAGAAARERDDLGLPSAADVEPAEAPGAQGVVFGPPAPEIDASRRRPKRAEAEAEPGATPAEPAHAGEGAGRPPSPAGLFRADGRPSWWLDAPERIDGRIAVTGEGLGNDQTESREAALRAAREALERAAGAPPGRERVDSFLARRLPGDAPGRARFVSYVRLSARDPSAPAS